VLRKHTRYKSTRGRGERKKEQWQGEKGITRE